jgi:putative glutamine transport system substrate-binding protein
LDINFLSGRILMKRYISLFVVIAFCFLSLPFSGNGIAGTLQDIKRRGKLIAGVETDSPPLGFLDKKGFHKGFDIDVAKALSKELFGNEGAVQFISVTEGNRVALLNSGKIDIIVAPMTTTDERKEAVDFSIPYFISAQLILVRGNSQITKYEDLAGKKVATIRGSSGDTAIGELVPAAERVKFENNFEALHALRAHRVEAFVEDYIVLFNLLQKTPGLKMSGLQPFRPARYGLAVRKGDKEWLDFINSTLIKMRESGAYERLLGKWFGIEAKALWRLFKN